MLLGLGMTLDDITDPSKTVGNYDCILGTPQQWFNWHVGDNSVV